MTWLLLGIAILITLIALAAAAWLVFNLISAIRSTSAGAPWVALEDEVASLMWEMADPRPNEVVMDIGCGDARHLISAVEQYGVTAIGLEVAPAPLAAARRLIRKHGVKGKVTILNQSLSRADTSGVAVFFLYLTPKLLQEFVSQHLPRLAPNTRVVVARFPLPDIQPTATNRSKKHPVYLYSTPTS